ncbi:MAG: hypothetical protein LUM44_21350 [Pyrinomonadaceae bacterium]|nr:hypothetical protein [Pyrinomonadaceae bacterium]
MKKIREICEIPKYPFKPSNELDNLALALFGQNSDNSFVLSSHSPELRYGINVDNKALKQALALDYNDIYLPNFNQLGPNEKYVIHKIFYSTNNIICIIGGIGVGKTSLSKYLVNKLLPEIIHSAPKDTAKCPGVIYFDFKAFDDNTFPKHTPEIALKSFAKNLSVLIGARISIGKYFSILSEVGEVWNKILQNQSLDEPQNPAINWLRNELHKAELETWGANDKAKIIGGRRTLREKLENSEHNLFYFAALLNYIKEEYYTGHFPCLCIIIDNVDREPPEIHRTVEKTIKTFSNLCDVKVVFNVRQTTFHQGSDNFQQLVDKVPYCGPDPLEIVYSRIDNFLNKGSIYEKCLQTYKPKEALDVFGEKLKYIKKNFLENDRFIYFFNSLCGHSVRKGLKIAQSLIDNSVYNPIDIPTDEIASNTDSKQLRMGDILRALMVRSNETFEYDGVIENIFQTDGSQNISHFIKLRILKALRKPGDAGLKITRLIKLLEPFNYPDHLIEDSLDEMLSDNKRLIWTDTSTTETISSNYLIKNKPDSKIFISSIGLGYINFLCKNVDYIQEVIMDTAVESKFIGSNFNYHRIDDRLTLLLRFFEYLCKKEEVEIKRYLKTSNPDDYHRAFGDKNLISLEIMEAVSKDVKAILDFVFEHSKGNFKENIKEFEKSHSAMYYLRISEATKIQRTLLGN